MTTLMIRFLLDELWQRIFHIHHLYESWLLILLLTTSINTDSNQDGAAQKNLVDQQQIPGFVPRLQRATSE